ncbi:MAG: hypothetical protein ACI4TB_11445 [Lachnospiraceae bacterium]
MGKRKITCSILLLCLVLFSGCGEKLPQMTEEQENQIVEYAAGIVMQHMRDDESRLVDLSLYEEKPEDVPQESEPETGKMDETADTETIDITGEGNFGTLDELLVPQGISIIYTGCKIVDSYPDDESGNPYFALDASTGKKLLVMQFSLQNMTETEIEVDIFSLFPKFTVTINGTEKESVLSTMLLDDLSTYIGNMAGGEEVALVLLTEVDSSVSEMIDSLQLKVKTDDGSVTTLLQ